MISIDHSTRVGKIAILLSVTDEDEETLLKEFLAGRGDTRAAVTFIAGTAQKIKTTYTKSIISAAVARGVIKETPDQVHAVLHASIEAFEPMMSPMSLAKNLKAKVAIVADKRWVAVAAYGDSAFSSITNHERGGFGIMHL